MTSSQHTGYQAKIILDSMSPDGVRLTTMEVTFPRFVLAEFNTHRMFSRNSASSRAIPVEKQLQKIINTPVTPFLWGKNQKGMQAEAELDLADQAAATQIWLQARDAAVEYATLLQKLGVHKQLINRLLEPFMWHTVLVTATEWFNFFGLRGHTDTQPELRHPATMMRDCYQQHTPRLCPSFDTWHLPLVMNQEGNFIFPEDQAQAVLLAQELNLSVIEVLKRVSVGRCARVSYLTHDGKRDLTADLQLFDRLLSGRHLSCFEHVAVPFNNHYTNFDDWDTCEEDYRQKRIRAWSGNFRGWRQFRSEIPHEEDFSKKVEEI